MTCSFSKEFSSSNYTSVENVFVKEYLPELTGDAVKVYLYGLYLCCNPAADVSAEEIAKTLNTDKAVIVDLFVYLEEFGLCSVLSKDPLTVEYLPLSVRSAKPRKINAEKYSDFTKGLQLLLPSRMISTSEYSEYFNIMENYGIKPEAMLMIVKYCVDRKGGDIGYRYISAVAKDFGNRGVTTVDKVENELSSYILRTSEIEKIIKALHLKRQPDIEDQKLYKKWTNELGFETENIVYAAGRIKKGNMAKLDDFLMELYAIKSFSKTEIADYLDKKDAVYALAVKINRALSVYVEVLDAEVDTYVKKWLSYGYEDQTLCLIASHCFKTGNNNLQYMDVLVDDLRRRGFISLSSVGDYFENRKKSDDFIAKLLATAGINRRPNDWDRENLNIWKGWNFSEDMIIHAARLAAGKTSPIPYMHGILSNWKNNGVFTEEALNVSTEDTSQEEYNREYERRREQALIKAQKNLARAMETDGFAPLYSRLNGIEKDLAFAEIAGNADALKNLEKEKAELQRKTEALLAGIGLTYEDLSPRYRCTKCNDTGYVGTSKCDCFDKR